jgi:hypothetical protein
MHSTFWNFKRKYFLHKILFLFLLSLSIGLKTLYSIFQTKIPLYLPVMPRPILPSLLYTVRWNMNGPFSLVILFLSFYYYWYTVTWDTEFWTEISAKEQYHKVDNGKRIPLKFWIFCYICRHIKMLVAFCALVIAHYTSFIKGVWEERVFLVSEILFLKF